MPGNQIGLQGPVNYGGVQPFNNWMLTGDKMFVTVLCAAKIQSIVSIGGGYLQATTVGPHGLYNPNYVNSSNTLFSGVGPWSFSISNTNSGTSGWNHNGNFDGTVTGPNTFVYPGTVGTGTVTSADFSYVLDGGQSPNQGASLWGVNGDLFQFVDANREVKPGIPLATQLTISRLIYTWDFGTNARIPNGFSRAGYNMAVQWKAGTGTTAHCFNASGANAMAPAIVTFAMAAGNDANFSFAIVCDPNDVPQGVYVGLAANLSKWNAGQYCTNAYQNMLASAGSVLRSMDWFNTTSNPTLNNFASWPSPLSSCWSPTGLGPTPRTIATPFEAFIQLCNNTNRHPWINIPAHFMVSKTHSVAAISRSLPGQNAFLTVGNPVNGGRAPYKHNFTTGDVVTPYRIGGAAPSVQCNGVGLSASMSGGTTMTVTGVAGILSITAKIDDGAGNAGNILTVTAGSGLFVGQTIRSAGATDCFITGFNTAVANGSNVGGTGTYYVSGSPQLVASATMEAAILIYPGMGIGGVSGCLNGSWIVSQLTSTAPGGELNREGTYQINQAQTFNATTLNLSCAAGMNYSTSTFTWPGHPWKAGQTIVVSGQNGRTLPPQLTTGMVVYVCNPSGNTFQVSKNISDALAGTPITFTGGPVGAANFNNGLTSDVINRKFTVGATTDYTIELLHCDSSAFGALTTAAVGMPVGFGPSGYVATVYDETHFRAEITNLVNAVKAQLKPGLIPRYEWGNENWNPGFISNFLLQANTVNFVDPATGIPHFPGDTSGPNMHGYIVAVAFDAVRLAYGGDANKSKWIGNMSTWAGNTNSWTTKMYVGMDYFIANNTSGVTFRDQIYDNVSGLSYWGGGMFVNPGSSFITSGAAVTITVDPAGVTPSTVTVATNNSASSGYNYKVLPIFFSNTGGSLPTEKVSGLPLGAGNGSPLVSFTMTAFNPDGSFQVGGTSPPTLTVGMTIYYNVNGGNDQGNFWNFAPRKITAVLGVNLYQTDNTGPTPSALPRTYLARDLLANTTVYWINTPVAGATTFNFYKTQADAIAQTNPVICTQLNGGSNFCQSATATLLCNYMNDSEAKWKADPVTYPSKYTYWDATVNDQLINNTHRWKQVRTSNINPETGAKDGIFTAGDFAPMIAAASTVRKTPGYVVYEGDNGNYAFSKGSSPGGVAMTADPQFCEFMPQAWGTKAAGKVWTSLYNSFQTCPNDYAAFTGNAAYAGIIVGEPAFFVDTGNPTAAFQFGSAYVCDDVQGWGSPNWEGQLNAANSNLNHRPLWDALVATQAGVAPTRPSIFVLTT